MKEGGLNEKGGGRGGGGGRGMREQRDERTRAKESMYVWVLVFCMCVLDEMQSCTRIICSQLEKACTCIVSKCQYSKSLSVTC